jgi:hypothetical protein
MKKSPSISINQCCNAKDWLFFLIDTQSHEKLNKVVLTLWAIRSARRKPIYEELFQSSQTVYVFITNYLSELNLMHSIKVTRVRAPTASPSVPWITPPSNTVKVNVDASVSKHGNRGVIVAICRDDTGAFLGASVFAVQGIFRGYSMSQRALALCANLQVGRFFSHQIS